jgi:hypothetical protein
MAFQNRIAFIFVVVWIVLGLLSAGIFFFNRDAKLKRRLWGPFVILAGVLFTGFTWLMGAPILFVGPAVLAITLLNLRSVKFCDACGRTIHSPNPFSPASFCSKCGAELK